MTISHTALSERVTGGSVWVSGPDSRAANLSGGRPDQYARRAPTDRYGIVAEDASRRAGLHIRRTQRNSDRYFPEAPRDDGRAAPEDGQAQDLVIGVASRPWAYARREHKAVKSRPISLQNISPNTGSPPPA